MGSAVPAPLARRVHEAAHLTGDFVLRSGARSGEYFDKYRFEADPALLAEIVAAMAGLLPTGVDALAGVELGGIPLATALSARTGLPARFVRKRAKEYGTRRLAEGGAVEGLSLVVVEDVVSTGGQLIESCAALRSAGARITTVVCVIDRETGGEQNLAAQDLTLRALLTASELRAAGGG